MCYCVEALTKQRTSPWVIFEDAKKLSTFEWLLMLHEPCFFLNQK